jgi:hypothetical protein
MKKRHSNKFLRRRDDEVSLFLLRCSRGCNDDDVLFSLLRREASERENERK